MPQTDALGDRMKRQYEDRTRYMLPRRSYTIVRIDGRAFHSYSDRAGLARPYDAAFLIVMDETAKTLCTEIEGAQLAYVQSDEISLLLTDFANIDTSAWFNGNIQKIASVSAAIATAAFNMLRLQQTLQQAGSMGTAAVVDFAFFKPWATFDARAFTIPDPTEVYNYFVWRQKDAIKNSISMAARTYFAHSELLGKTGNEQQELLFQKGINWSKYPEGFKNGRLVQRMLGTWNVRPAPIFTRTPDFLQALIPRYP